MLPPILLCIGCLIPDCNRFTVLFTTSIEMKLQLLVSRIQTEISFACFCLVLFGFMPHRRHLTYCNTGLIKTNILMRRHYTWCLIRIQYVDGSNYTRDKTVSMLTNKLLRCVSHYSNIFGDISFIHCHFELCFNVFKCTRNKISVGSEKDAYTW